MVLGLEDGATRVPRHAVSFFEDSFAGTTVGGMLPPADPEALGTAALRTRARRRLIEPIVTSDSSAKSSGSDRRPGAVSSAAGGHAVLRTGTGLFAGLPVA